MKTFIGVLNPNIIDCPRMDSPRMDIIFSRYVKHEYKSMNSICEIKVF